MTELILDKPEDFYKYFVSDDMGKNAINEAKLKYPKFNTGGLDTKKAVVYVFDKMNTWLYDYTPSIHELEIEVFLDSFGAKLKKEIQKNLIVT